MQRFVIIVGAGPVGLMLGNLLGQSGANVLILERRTEAPRFTSAKGPATNASASYGAAA